MEISARRAAEVWVLTNDALRLDAADLWRQKLQLSGIEATVIW